MGRVGVLLGLLCLCLQHEVSPAPAQEQGHEVNEREQQQQQQQQQQLLWEEEYRAYRVALEARFALDSRANEKQVEEHRNHPLCEPYERWRSQLPPIALEFSTPSRLVRNFCADGGLGVLFANNKTCSWHDANFLLAWEKAFHPEVFDKIDTALSPQTRFVQAFEALKASMPELGDAGVYECERLSSPPTAIEFLTRYVAASRPVIIEGAAANWSAIGRSKHRSGEAEAPSRRRMWTLESLLAQAGDEVVKAYVSLDGAFERVQTAGDWEKLATAHGARLVTPAASDEKLSHQEPILVRPAETEMPFKQFVHLLRAQFSTGDDIIGKGVGRGRGRAAKAGGDMRHPQRLAFYLQKHNLELWRDIGLVDDLSPVPHEDESFDGFARFLKLQHHLLWLAGTRARPREMSSADSVHQTHSQSSSRSQDFIRGPIHYDPQENLHTVVRGTKLFELFHPLQGAELYEKDGNYRSAFLLYKWEEAKRAERNTRSTKPGQELGHDGQHHLWRLPLTVAERSHQPFSPVNVGAPDEAKHPRFVANARKVVCEVRPGETLYIPSHWWHEVTSWGDRAEDGGDGSTSGGADFDGHGLDLSVGVNFFYEPFYRKTDQLSFVRNSFYAHLWDLITTKPETRNNNHTGFAADVEATTGGENLFGTKGSLLRASLSQDFAQAGDVGMGVTREQDENENGGATALHAGSFWN